MAKLRKRYYFWLFKAYFKRWKRTIVTSLIVGIIISGLGIAFLNFYIRPSIDNKIQRIGVLGVYKPDNLPDSLLLDVSYGLTRLNDKGEIQPAGAERWEIKQDGKEYVFHLKKGIQFHNGDQFNAETLNMNFKDAKKTIIDPHTVSFTLSDPYTPFLSVVSRPIILSDFSGLGKYRLRDVELNAGFVKSLSLQDRNDRFHKKLIYFYPTQSALKTAYMLGEVDTISGVNTLNVEHMDLSKWSNTQIEENINYNELVTLFYNNEDSNLSNKKFRQALNYALPDTFQEGKRAFSPIPPNSIYFSSNPSSEITDKEIASELMSSIELEPNTEIEITTPTELETTAKVVAEHWNQIGIKTKITVRDDVPATFQVLLYKYRLPLDPDQYTYWHSDQVNNIGKYKNLRIDKLLEDGRIETDTQERINIYADFQKYLVDDVPASFLFFPKDYKVKRK